MPRNLLLNYLDEVRRQREFLLARWQLPIPSHLEKVDSYAHNGMLQDYAYRLPWLRVPDKDSVQHYANIDHLVDDLQQLVHNASDLEDFKPTTSIIHVLHNDGEVSEVVPSSNPDSPPLDKDLVAEISRQTSRKDTEEYFLSEWSSRKEDEEFPPALMEPNIFQESLSKLPRLETLCERLKPKPVQDPLDRNDQDIIRQELKYDGGPMPDQEKPKERDLVDSTEIFQKTNLMPSQEMSFVEEPEIIGHKEENYKPLDHLQAEDLCDHIISDDFLNSSVEKDHSSLEKYKSAVSARKPLSKLNSEGVRERKKVMEAFLSESVITSDDEPTSEETSVVGIIKTMELDKEEEPNFEDIKCILSPFDEQKISTTVWKKEKQFIKLPSFLLQEPRVDVTKKDQVSVPHQVTALDSLKLKSIKVTMGSQLHWNPVEASMDQMRKVSNRTESYAGNMDGKCSTDNGQTVLKNELQKVDLNPFITWDQSDEQLHLEEHGHDESPCVSSRAEAEAVEYKVDDKFLASNPAKESSERQLPANQNHQHNPGIKSQTHHTKIVMTSGAQKESTMATAHIEKHPDSCVGGVTSIDTLKEKIKEKVDSVMPKAKEKQKTTEIADPVVPKERVKDKMKANPLDDFLMLRTIQVKREENKSSPPKKVSKITKNAPLRDEIAPIRDINQDKTTATKQSQDVVVSEKSSSKKSKNKQVDVMLTDLFLDTLAAIDKACLPVLNQLRKMGIISASYSLSSLTPDITRFLLKQHEKIQDTAPKTDQMEMKLRCLVHLHALITAVDLITHCDLTIAILHLSGVQEKYANILQGCLDNIRQTLYEKQCKLHKEKVLHPKLLATIRQITDWFKRKLSKNNGDQDPKILVIIRREARRLVDMVKEALSKVPGISTSCSQLSQVSYDIVSKQLDTCNCLVLTATQIGQDFPWALFSLVLEYEYVEASPWLELCHRQHIRHIALKTVSTGVKKQADVDKDYMEADAGSQSQGGKALKLIASQDVITCSQLLQLLESKHDIMLLERNYSKVLTESDTMQLYYADLIVDERTGIVLQELQKLTEPHTVEPVVNRVIKLSLQFSQCWLILYPEKGKNAGYPLGGQAVNNISRLHAALAQFSVKTDGFEAKVLFADSLSEVAQLIRHIADNAAKTTKNWHQADWHTRPWLTNTGSKHEKVLLQFPCLNAFSTQVMLTAAPLRELLAMSLPQLKETCPWIQHRHLQMFHSLVHGVDKKVVVPQSSEPKLENLQPKHQPSISDKQRLQNNTASSTPSHQERAGAGDRYHEQHPRGNAFAQQVPMARKRSSDQGRVLEVYQQQQQPVSMATMKMEWNDDGYTANEYGMQSKQGHHNAQQNVPKRPHRDMTHMGDVPKRPYQEMTHMDDHKGAYQEQLKYMDVPKRSYQDMSHMDIPKRPYQEMPNMESVVKSIKKEPGVTSSASNMIYEQKSKSMQSVLHPRVPKVEDCHSAYEMTSAQQPERVNSQQSYVPHQTDRPYEMGSAQQPRGVSSQHLPHHTDRYPAQTVTHHTDSDRYPAQRLSNYQQYSTHGYEDQRSSVPQRHDHIQPIHAALSRQSHPQPMHYTERPPDHFARDRSMDRTHQDMNQPQHSMRRSGSFDTSMGSVVTSGQYQQEVPVMEPYQEYGTSRHPDAWNLARHTATPMRSATEFEEYQRDQSVPSSAEMEAGDSYMDRYHGDLDYDRQREIDNQQVPLTPSKNKRLTYERVPGAKSGQTRLCSTSSY